MKRIALLSTISQSGITGWMDCFGVDYYLIARGTRPVPVAVPSQAGTSHNGGVPFPCLFQTHKEAQISNEIVDTLVVPPPPQPSSMSSCAGGHLPTR